MGTESPSRKPRFAVATTLDTWRYELRIAAGVNDRLRDRLERVEREMRDMQRACRGNAVVHAGLEGPAVPEPVVYMLDRHDNSDGSMVIALNGGQSVKLSPQLAEVFRFIASGDTSQDSDDPLVGWRSRAEILDHLAKIFNRRYPPRYVNNLLGRIKKALADAHYRGYIQTNRRQGVRLAFLRSSARASRQANR